jgi:hypothetical protein
MLIIYSLFFSVLENLRVDARITAAPNATPTATQTGSLVATAIDVPTATPIAIHPPFLFFPNIAFLLYYSHSIVTLKQPLAMKGFASRKSDFTTLTQDVRSIFSFLRPFASSSTSLSRYRHFFVSGVSMSSIR